ncbi:MAG: flagellar M-ring protein FliF [Maricaulis sp.]|nr:flagellar M-ring protein FliF [Maricaulis sp.]
MNGLLDQFKSLGPVRLMAIFGLAVGIAMALVFFTTNMGGGSQSLLYSSLSPSDASAASERLDEAGITYEFRNGGSSIYVPRDQVDEARVRVASGGALGFGSVGYEIFDNTDALGTTSFVQNLNAKRALEGELARTIQSLDPIATARVHLVLPERRLFERESTQPSAVITVSARGEMNDRQLAIIRNIVASAVPNLEPGQITVADTTGRYFIGPNPGEEAGAGIIDDRRQRLEEQLRARILNLVEGVVGTGSARVQVSAELDRTSMTESQEIFDPEGQVVLSRDRTEEESLDTEGNDGAVSASENLPEDAAGGSGDPRVASTRTNSHETVNYENSRTTRTHVREAGAVERLSVAVAVDGVWEAGEDGTLTYRERTPEEMSRIEALVRSAMGFTANDVRQDALEVTNVRFARADPSLGTPASSGFSFSKNDMMRVAEIAVMFITALLVIFLVARPLAKGAGSAPTLALAGAAAGEGGGAAVAGPEAQAAVANQSAGSGASLPAPEAYDAGIDIAKIDGQVKASSVKKVVGIVDQHPDESMSILRTWMSEN